MEKTKILSASFLDILFDGRNKAYGAYELRNTYNRRLVKALGATGLVIAVFMGATALKATESKSKLAHIVGPTIEITKIEEPEKAEPPAPKPPKMQEPKKIETAKFVIPKITPDEKVITAPPAQDDLADVKIGIENIKGDKLGDIATPPLGVPDGKGLIETKRVDNDDTRFTKIEKEAEYSGDWARFLTTNLRSEIPVDNGAPTGSYQVIVQFVVDVNGAVSDIKVARDPGFGMAEEAIRVIKKSGKWKPAIQNGIAVKAYRKQPITFQVVEQ
ncbi:energy transducer TonB [Niabella beijingensis]|uniref:energy transducer TonB n=1 Tax=Niabella beijingensis TaxID=2872700 RepID=UPI001CBD8A63|nr:energy transducer TonB [Niabella beijingensis]MBZ4189971.1 energy transducer TonB [Niabella beijingensis]